MKVCPCEKKTEIYIETSATIAHFVLHVLKQRDCLHVLKQREDVARGHRIHVVRTLEALVP
jgi:DNA-binding phage protein